MTLGEFRGFYGGVKKGARSGGVADAQEQYVLLVEFGYSKTREFTKKAIDCYKS